MTTARTGGRPCRRRYAATSSLTACRISAAIGPPSSSRAPPRGTAISASRGNGIPRLAAPDGGVNGRSELLDRIDEAHHARGRLADIRLVVDRRKVDQDV